MKRTDNMEKKTADFARSYNSSKNSELAEELSRFLNGDYEENDESGMQFTALVKVVIGRLKNISDNPKNEQPAASHLAKHFHRRKQRKS